MADTETTPRTCAEHPDRPAVGTCGRCGRALCVECAIPFRGELRCEADAALELGDPTPEPQPNRRRVGIDHVALALLVIALASTIPPWHRSGTLTSTLSVWRPFPDPWSTVAAGAVVTAIGLLVLTVRRPRTGRAVRVVWALLAALAWASTLVTFLRAPEFFSTTLAPVVMLVAAGGAALLGLVRARRFRTAP
ncbi:MAG: B-box zinc finger protein [Actinomycetota bacterium]|nr:B-box zinc finger protein [Actinomycetota bacterium]